MPQFGRGYPSDERGSRDVFRTPADNDQTGLKPTMNGAPASSRKRSRTIEIALMAGALLCLIATLGVAVAMALHETSPEDSALNSVENHDALFGSAPVDSRSSTARP